VWSGDPTTRERDAAKGCCAAWCDTEFRVSHPGENGGKYEAAELAVKVRSLYKHRDVGLVVLTGGEPSLQVDNLLVRLLKSWELQVAMETNGSKDVSRLGLDWVTLSPKPPMQVVDQHYDEVKCVYPAGFDPEDYAKYANVRWVQPRDAYTQYPSDTIAYVLRPTESIIRTANEEVMRRCVDYVLDHPQWKMGIQAHKHWGVA
jgi:organic radical activating enzyme